VPLANRLEKFPRAGAILLTVLKFGATIARLSNGWLTEFRGSREYRFFSALGCLMTRHITGALFFHIYQYIYYEYGLQQTPALKKGH
jgi:hypothetical protein